MKKKHFEEKQQAEQVKEATKEATKEKEESAYKQAKEEFYTNQQQKEKHT